MTVRVAPGATVGVAGGVAVGLVARAVAVPDAGGKGLRVAVDEGGRVTVRVTVRVGDVVGVGGGLVTVAVGLAIAAGSSAMRYVLISLAPMLACICPPANGAAARSVSMSVV